MFETLLHIDTLRGEDSTGVFLVDNLGNVEIAKDVLTGENFMKTSEWKETNRHAFRDGWAMVGHNRKATRGSISEENAHPFWIDDKLVLVHNGSYNGSHKHLKNTDVDSQAIAHILAEHGDNDIEGALKKVNAAYALIWYDVDKKKLNIIRNPERPLCWVETHDAWYFTSDQKMMDFALYFSDEKPLEKIQCQPEYVLTSFVLESGKGTSVDSTAIDCKYKYEGTHQPYRYNPHGYMHPYAKDEMHEIYGTDWEEEVKKSVAIAVEVAKDSSNDSTTENPIAIMPFTPRVKLSEFQKLREKYRDGNKITVIVDDYLDSDEKNIEVTVTGKTLDPDGIPVYFRLHRDILRQLTEPTTTNFDNAVFDVTVGGCSWRNTDGTKHKNIDDAYGVMTIKGKNPSLQFTGQGEGNA